MITPNASPTLLRVQTSRRGFSLIEVTLALAVTTFSMISVLGLLPVGLDTVRAAVVQTSEAGIARLIRAELQQVPLSQVIGLDGCDYYYTEQGRRLTGPKDAYFAATFAVSAPTIPDPGPDISSSARNVKITLKYPQFAPEASRRKSVFAMLVAEQRND